MNNLLRELKQTGATQKAYNLRYKEELRPSLYRLIDYIFRCDTAYEVDFDDFSIGDIECLFDATEGFYSAEELSNFDDEQQVYTANWNNPIYEYLRTTDAIRSIVFSNEKIPIQIEDDFI